MNAFASGFQANEGEHLRLRRGEADIVADAEEHGPRGSALFDNQRMAIVFDTAE